MLLVTVLSYGSPVLAGDCFADPVFRYTGNGSMKSAAFLRDQACMEGSSVLTAVPAGSAVQILGYTDGWYVISWNGGRGWVGQQFIQNGATQTEQTQSYIEFMSDLPSIKPSSTSKPVPPASIDPKFLSRVKGYILLQAEQHGEAWYIDPITSKRYYMKNGATAYQMMRSFGLGITETDFAKVQKGEAALKQKFSGRILLRVQAHGEAYYIHPKTLDLHYLQNGDEAYRVMRLYSLGIKDADLARINVGELIQK